MRFAVCSARSAPTWACGAESSITFWCAKIEPKPLRIFMQDGVHDEWPGGPEMGDWWMSNQTMNRALEFAGYDVRHVWGTGTHNGSQAACSISRSDALALAGLARSLAGAAAWQSGA